MLVKCLQICAHVFIDRPQNSAQTSFRSCAGLRPNFGHSRSKLCPIMGRSRTNLCPNFGCSRARLCSISFAPCPFPNLAGTLDCRILRSLVYRQDTHGPQHWATPAKTTLEVSDALNTRPQPARPLCVDACDLCPAKAIGWPRPGTV